MKQGESKPDHAIVAESLTYRYGGLLAVDHINFDVAEGEVLPTQYRTKLIPGKSKSTFVRRLEI